MHSLILTCLINGFPHADLVSNCQCVFSFDYMYGLDDRKSTIVNIDEEYGEVGGLRPLFTFSTGLLPSSPP